MDVHGLASRKRRTLGLLREMPESEILRDTVWSRDRAGRAALHTSTLPPLLRRHHRAVKESTNTEVTETRSEEHTSELQSRLHLVCRLLLEKKKKKKNKKQ